MKKPSLLIVSSTDSRKDPRVWRQICCLKDEYNVTVVALTDCMVKNVNWIPIALKNSSKNWLLRKLSKAWNIIIKKDYNTWLMSSFSPAIEGEPKEYEVVICNDQSPLGWAFKLANGAPVVFDAHEYYPREFESSMKWRILLKKYNEWICKTFIPQCAAVTTVSDGIAEEYKKNFACNPVVIKNAPEFENLEPQKVNGQIKIIHHGGAIPDRCLELMIETKKYLDDRFLLDLMLVDYGRKYYEKIKEMALNTPGVNWLQPVKMQDIAKKCNEYDIGLFLVPAVTFNLQCCLPNKFFEFIQARLAIAVGPSIEMAKIVRERDLGVVSQDFSPLSMAEALNSLTYEDIMRFKFNSHEAARVYNSENEMKKLKEVLNNVRNIRLGTER